MGFEIVPFNQNDPIIRALPHNDGDAGMPKMGIGRFGKQLVRNGPPTIQPRSVSVRD
jgi:hypothetical protein